MHEVKSEKKIAAGFFRPAGVPTRLELANATIVAMLRPLSHQRSLLLLHEHKADAGFSRKGEQLTTDEVAALVRASSDAARAMLEYVLVSVTDVQLEDGPLQAANTQELRAMLIEGLVEAGQAGVVIDEAAKLAGLLEGNSDSSSGGSGTPSEPSAPPAGETTSTAVEPTT